MAKVWRGFLFLRNTQHVHIHRILFTQKRFYLSPKQPPSQNQDSVSHTLIQHSKASSCSWFFSHALFSLTFSKDVWEKCRIKLQNVKPEETNQVTWFLINQHVTDSSMNLLLFSIWFNLVTFPTVFFRNYSRMKKKQASDRIFSLFSIPCFLPWICLGFLCNPPLFIATIWF